MSDARAVLKRSIRGFRTQSDAAAAVLLLFDVLLFSALLGTVLVARSGAVKLVAATFVGLSIARLFVIGHDACHQSFFSDRRWNRWIGRFAFLPSLTTYSLWEAGHNLGHHVFTNLRGRDYVWTPFSKAEFDALPAVRRALERFYRSGVGFGAYYLIELWWRKLMFPTRAELPGRKPVHVWDSLFVSAFAAIWIAAVAVVAVVTSQSVGQVVFFAFFWPTLVWTVLMGAVIYLHHTHPRLQWYVDLDLWEAARDGVSSTVHVTFAPGLDWLLNNIMIHPAHHLDVRVPLYRLDPAQRSLDDAGATAVEQRFSFRYAWDTLKRCKLYDYGERRWMDFAGRYTSDARPVHADDRA